MTILSTFTNLILKIKKKVDVQNIAVYEQENNTEIFLGVRYLSGSVSDDLKIMEHPKEDGTVIADHTVNDPKTATISMLIADDDTDSLNEILDYYNSKTPVTVKIKNEIYGNLIISSKPVKAESEYFDKTKYDLSFKEVINAKTVYVKMSVPQVKNKKNASTIKTGQKRPNSNNSALYDLKKGKIRLGKIRLK